MVLAARCETLREHINTGLKMLDEHFIRLGYADFISRKTGISDSKELLKMTILLHDIAKGYDEYQEKVLAGKGFPKHEYFSAAVADKVLLVNAEKKDIVELAIIWHHMAMRSPKLRADIKTWNKFKAPSLISLKAPEEIIDIIETACSTWSIKNVNASILPIKVTFNKDVYPIVLRLQEKLTKTGNRLKFYLNTIFFLRALIICDNLAARENRKKCINDSYLQIFLRDLPSPQDIIEARKQIQKMLT